MEVLKVLIAFPGRFGTLDELFETLALIQVKPVSVRLIGREYWQRIINFNTMTEEGQSIHRVCNYFSMLKHRKKSDA